MTLTPSVVPRPPAPTASGAPEHPHVRIVVDRCAGCQECIVRCPTGALDLDVATWTVAADDAICVGCRQCERVCPFGAITVSGPLAVAARITPEAREIDYLVEPRAETRPGLPDWDAALAEAARCLRCPDPTCVRGCPAHNDIPGFIAALAAGDLDQAHAVLARTTSLPDVCARVCDQATQCEGACSWSLAGGQPVAIGLLERFVVDHAPIATGAPGRESGGSGLRVAVVGSGPAGLAAAGELIRHGARVTVFEKDPVPGGLLAWGIPDFTLPRSVKRRPWDDLLAAGVELHCGHEVTPDELARLRAEFTAVILAHGASVPLPLRVPGSELTGVVDASTFLQGVSLGGVSLGGVSLGQGPSEPVPDDAADAADPVATIQQRALMEVFGRSAGRAGTHQVGTSDAPPVVLVLGAGNTAMDVARTARRLGARAICVDWLAERFAPVRPDELAEARQEGVDVRFGMTLVALEGTDGHVRRARLATTVQATADERPRLVPNETEEVVVDLVVAAMGYRVDPALAGEPRALRRRREPPAQVLEPTWAAAGIFAIDAPVAARTRPVGRLSLAREQARLEASLPVAPGLFVVGDASVGPSTVVEAMAQGRSAARAILTAARDTTGRQDGRPPGRVVLLDDGSGVRARDTAAILAGALSARGSLQEWLVARPVDPTRIAGADVVVVVSEVTPSRVLGRPLARRQARRLVDLDVWPAGTALAMVTVGATGAESLAEQLTAGLVAAGAPRPLFARLVDPARLGTDAAGVGEELAQLAADLAAQRTASFVTGRVA